MDLLMKTQVQEFLLKKSKKSKKSDFFRYNLKYNHNLINLQDDLKWLAHINLFKMSILNLRVIVNRMINVLENKNILKVDEVTVDKNIQILEIDYHRYSYLRTKLLTLNIFYNDEIRKKEIVYILKKYIPNRLNFYISSFNFIKM